MKKRFALLLALLLAFSCCAQAEGRYVFNPGKWSDRLHLRTKPDKAAPSLGRYYTGVRVHVIEDLGEWANVRIASGIAGAETEGYMMTEFLCSGGPMAGWQPYRTVTVPGQLTDAAEKPVGQVAAGESVFLLADCGRQAHVMTAEGVMGYLPADALSSAQQPADTERILIESAAVASGGAALYAGLSADAPVVATLYGGVVLEDVQLLPDRKAALAAVGDASDSARGFLREGGWTYVDNGANCGVEYPVYEQDGTIIEVLGQLYDGQYILRRTDTLYGPAVVTLVSQSMLEALTAPAQKAGKYGSYFSYVTPLQGEISDAQAIETARAHFDEGGFIVDAVTGERLTHEAFDALTARVQRAISVQYGDTLLLVQFLDADGIVRTEVELAPDSGRIISWGGNG